MPSLLQQFAVDEVTMCRRPAVPRARVAVVKSAGATSTPRDMPNAVQNLIASLRAAVGAVDKSAADAVEVDTALAEVEAHLLGTVGKEGELIQLAAAPNAAVQKQIDELTVLQKSLEAKEVALTTMLKQATDEREATAIAKSEGDAREMLGSVSGDVSLLASLLRKASPEERGALEGSYRSAATVAKSAPPTRFGALRVMKSDEPSLAGIAKSYQEKDPKLTPEAAVAKAARDNPQVYEAEVMAQRAATAAMGI